MSATIKWQVTSVGNELKGVASPSSFIAAMIRAFGEPPWQLDRSCIPKLEGMDATTGPGSAFELLLKLLSNFESIDVWAEY